MTARYTSVASALLLALVLSACGGGGSDRAGGEPPTMETTDFTVFVKDTLGQPADGEPVAINGLRFNDRDRENPNAYDDRL